MTLSVYLRGIGVIGPGFADWPAARSALLEPASWSSQPTVIAAPSRLPPAERRRSGAIVKLSIGVAEQACAMAGVEPRELATVFSSACSDTANCHALCEALAMDERVVSPTRFTNSVHNAPSGYWHIATSSRAPSTSLAAYDSSFAMTLLEAVTQAASWRRPVLLVCADVPFPEPLHAKRPLLDAFAVALVIDVASAGAIARLSLGATSGPAHAQVLPHEGLESLRTHVPAARSLGLLRALAGGATGSVVLDEMPGFALGIELADIAAPA